MSLAIYVPKEMKAFEKRVALSPESVGKLTSAGVQVVVEPDAGRGYYPDSEYQKAGATLDKTPQALIVRVQPPTPEDIANYPENAVLVSLLYPHQNLDAIHAMQAKKMTAFALELVPRITRAQVMDVLSSQATVSGYKAVLIAANLCPRFFPMLTTAAGTIRPAKVLILGAGVAGLQAIATARRLGANVEAYDVRRAAGEQVRSLGAKFLELKIDAEGSGGYARELTPEEKQAEQDMLANAIAGADVVITTAQIPGRAAPRLVSSSMVQAMKAGSVIVDLAGESGGNVEGSVLGEHVQVGGVVLYAPNNVPSLLPFHASEMYSKNLMAFLGLLTNNLSNLNYNLDDEILAGSVVLHQGEIKHAATLQLLGGN